MGSLQREQLSPVTVTVKLNLKHLKYKIKRKMSTCGI